MRPASFRIGDMTIHRIVESEAPFMAAMEFLPDLTPEILDEHRSWLKLPGPAVHFWNGSATAEHCAARPIFHHRRWVISPGGATDFAARPFAAVAR